MGHFLSNSRALWRAVYLSAMAWGLQGLQAGEGDGLGEDANGVPRLELSDPPCQHTAQ